MSEVTTVMFANGERAHCARTHKVDQIAAVETREVFKSGTVYKTNLCMMCFCGEVARRLNIDITVYDQ